jgi:hypothetical protein
MATVSIYWFSGLLPHMAHVNMMTQQYCLYINQHKFVHYLHLVGAHHKFVGAHHKFVGTHRIINL